MITEKKEKVQKQSYITRLEELQHLKFQFQHQRILLYGLPWTSMEPYSSWEGSRESILSVSETPKFSNQLSP